MKKRLMISALSATLFCCCGMTQAQVELSGLDKDMAGPRAQVLVLGTTHLSGMPEDFKPASLDPLLAKLAAFKPDVITIESIPGESCDLMARYPMVYDPESVSPYCSKTDAAKAATGLDVPAAIAEVTRTLAGWPAQPSAAQRRHLSALFLAANDDASALVQWLQLPDAERHAGDGLDDALATLLHGRETARNEDYLIAAHLAARLGLQRVYGVDDHTGDNIAIDDEEAYGKAIQGAWDAGHVKSQPIHDRETALEKGGDMLALYRFLNDPAVMRIAIDSDFGEALRETSPQHYGQRYVAGWETRNLRMASNVRAAFEDHPGARVLSIVGASHKPWFDAFLGQMQGVDVVDAQQVLKAP